MSSTLLVVVVGRLVPELGGPSRPLSFLDAPCFAALILGLALMERPVLGVLSWRRLVRLGEASYSLYLTHLPLALLALMRIRAVEWLGGGAAPGESGDFISRCAADSGHASQRWANSDTFLDLRPV